MNAAKAAELVVVQHIFAKDLRRLRWLLVAWLAIVAGRVALSAAASELAFMDEALQIAIGSVSTPLVIVDTLMLVLLVSWLVHDEPLVGADAFWLTRPIRPTTLMLEKLTFGAVFLVAAPAIAQAATTAIVMRSAIDATHVLPAVVFSQALWVAALIAIATLTPSAMRFLLTLAGMIAAAAVAISVVMAVLLVFANVDEPGGTFSVPDRTSPIVNGVVLLTGALLVIGSQYRTRRLRRGVAIGIAGVVFGLFAGDAFPWRFAKAAEPQLGAWAEDRTRVTAVMDNAPPYVTDAVFVRGGATPKKHIAAPLRITGIPLGYQIDSVVVRGRLEFPDGHVIESVAGGLQSVRHEGATRPIGLGAAMQAALGSATLLRSPEEDSYDLWPVVLSVSDDEYERYGRTPGRLTGTATAFLRRWGIAGSMPLVEGATLRARSRRIELRRVVKRPDGCTLLVRRASTGGVDGGGWYAQQLALRNTQRSEAVLGDGQPLMDTGNFSFVTGVSMSTHVADPSLAFVDFVERFPARSARTPSSIDRAWIDGADVVVFEHAYAGRVARPITVDGFRMRP